LPVTSITPPYQPVFVNRKPGELSGLPAQPAQDPVQAVPHLSPRGLAVVGSGDQHAALGERAQE
jgi:hypothetical protein